MTFFSLAAKNRVADFVYDSEFADSRELLAVIVIRSESQRHITFFGITNRFIAFCNRIYSDASKNVWEKE